ncbi:MAG: GIY-YIG nuclease family protein [Bacteroidota bacterium]
MSYTVYILKSERAERYYIGSTEDFATRLVVHNGPRARWTKRFQPWRVVHTEEFVLRGEALKRERFLKSLKAIARHLGDMKGQKL